MEEEDERMRSERSSTRESSDDEETRTNGSLLEELEVASLENVDLGVVERRVGGLVESSVTGSKLLGAEKEKKAKEGKVSRRSRKGRNETRSNSHLRTSLFRELAVEDDDLLSSRLSSVSAGAGLRQRRSIGVDSRSRSEEVGVDLFLRLNVDGSLDVASGVLVSESAVDDVELGDFRGVLSVDEIVELREERRRGRVRTSR